MKIKTNHMITLTISVLLLIIVISGYIYMRNIVDNYVSQVIAANDLAASRDASRVESSGLVVEYNDTAQKRADLAKRLIPEKNIVNLIENLESLDNSTGSKVSIVSINTSPLDVTIHASSEGPWGSVMKALSLVETLPYASSVDSVNLSTSVLENSTTKGTVGGVYRHSWTLDFVLHAGLAATSTTP